MSVNAKMTALADEVRTLSGATDTLGLDEMASHTNEANAEVGTQTDLIQQLKIALQGKVAGSTPENLNAELTEQEALIAELQDTLRGKASGGGGDSTMEDGLITRTLTEYRNNRVATVGSYALSNVASLEKAVLPMAQTLRDYAFANDTVLKRVDILGGGTLAGSIATSCLLNCKSIAEIIMRNESAVTNLQSLFFPFYAGEANITRSFNRSQWNIFGTVGRLENWSGLTALVKGSITYFTGTVTDEASKPVWLFGEYADGSNRLKTLALVETEEEANALMLQYEEYFRSNGCQFYVPASLIDQYTKATNWSIYANQFRAIEEHPEICGEVTA